MIDYTLGTLGILLGNGDGTFQAVLNRNAGSNPSFLVVGDFNGDGISDLAVTGSTSTVLVLLGNRDGTFHVGSTNAVGSNPYGPAIGDFNGDGWLDLAVGDDSGVSLLLGDGVRHVPTRWQ